MKPLILLAVIVLLCAPAAAEEKKNDLPPLNISGTYTMLWRDFDEEFLARSRDHTQDTWELYNRLVLNLAMGDFTAGLQVDYDTFDIRDEYRELEKRYIEYRGHGWTATAGDFFGTFGRGSALSVAKTHELYGLENQIDNTVDGMRVRYSGEYFSVEGLLGDIDDRFNGSSDEIRGANGSVKLLPWLSVGGSAVSTDLQLEAEENDLLTGRIEISGLLDVIDAVYEKTELERTSDFGFEYADGEATYLEASLLLDDLIVSGEYKTLKNFFSKYSTSPIVEEETQELIADFFAYYPEDLQAMKLRLDYTLPTDTIVYLVAAHYDEKATRHPSYYFYDRELEHYYGGLEHSFDTGAHVALEFGRRNEMSRGYYYQFNGPLTHGGVEMSFPLSHRIGFSVDYRHSELDGDVINFQRNRVSVSLSRSPWLVVSGTWESSNLPGEVFFAGKDDFYFGQVEVKFLKKHAVRVLFGETRGGIKCSGGICKYVPAFDGVRFEAVLRF